MPTINDKATVDQIISHNGLFPGDRERVVRIVQYNNIFNGGIAYGLIYQGHSLDIYHKGATINPTIIWDYKQPEKKKNAA